jgi:hypothetical protein
MRPTNVAVPASRASGLAEAAVYVPEVTVYGPQRFVASFPLGRSENAA